ncbi:MAG: hypothetical protein E7062_01100 [Spirochaetaceae bacterium]|nr:hypothetical protein [Spirochaetaceae bacterium]
MAKITPESRSQFAEVSQPYKDLIQKVLEKEKSMLLIIERDSFGLGYKKLLLAEEMIYLSTLYMTINNLSVEILDAKNTDALNEARKILYRAVIYLEEIVTNYIDVPFADYEENLKEIANTPLEKRYYLVRKLGLAISLLIEAYGTNTKWKWAFVELQGRYATVAKNIFDMKEGSKSYFDLRSHDYDTTVEYFRLVKKLLADSANRYRERYELSTRRLDDMRLAINYLSALYRVHIAISEKSEAEEIKKKATVWKDKMDNDRKKGQNS